MKAIRWSAEKAALLRADRSRGSIGFEDALVALEAGKLLDVIPNPARPHQKMFVLDIHGYAYVVPFVETGDGIFLKTVYPSRKHTAIYLQEPRT